MPPYLEQIVADGNDLYVLFESASTHYRQADLEFHADRVLKLDLKTLLK
ncbi:hypothetical protein [Lacticaseibacillus paracasei]|nr:hypothetical protein [Lacticaseibacillus paracasei]